jgi:predicted O-linked N-acetylglucosamine transferase (SPINDLY family)
MAGSLLRAIGLPELITHAVTEYEALAFALATDRSRLAELRERLSGNRRSHPLFDTARFTKHLEQAYRAMQVRVDAAQSADHIVIAESA